MKKIHKTENAIAFESQIINDVETLTFSKTEHFIKVLSFVNDAKVASILLTHDEAIALRDFLTEITK